MELKKIYEEMNGDYDSVIQRLNNDRIVKKFLIKFIDNELDVLIRDAIDRGDWETAFREAHNLKGVCANLNLDALCVSAGNLTEALRGGKREVDIAPLVKAMQEDYDMTKNAISALVE